MKKFMSTLCAGSLGLAIGLAPAIPSVAAPMMTVPHIGGLSNVQTVQYRERNHRRPGYKKHRDQSRHWKGYRGERHKRQGYRRHSDGLWYPLAAFGLGAIIGGAIASQPEPAPAYGGGGLSNAHVQWCYDRYRSYRASDNTFQPYDGPRMQCRSPY